MTTLVIAEHDNNTLNTVTMNAVAAAQKISSATMVLVAGHQCVDVANEAAKISGIEKIIHVDAYEYEHFLAENLGALIFHLAHDFTHILAPATTFGKNVLPRVAALLNVSQVSDVSQVLSPDTFKRPIYAGNAMLTVKSTDPIKILTVRSTAFEAVSFGLHSTPIETVSYAVDTKKSSFIKQNLTPSSRPELTEAKIVVAGGRGVKTKEHFKLIEQLADCLGAAVGATRAAVDAGIVPNDLQIGQTGKVVAPEVYIAIGISGAIQHIAGIKDSKTIIAINSDKDAPIFEIADYGLVGDLFEVVPQLIANLSQAHKTAQ